MYGDENDANGANRIQNNLNTNLRRNYTAEQQDVIKPARTVPSRYLRHLCISVS